MIVGHCNKMEARQATRTDSSPHDKANARLSFTQRQIPEVSGGTKFTLYK